MKIVVLDGYTLNPGDLSWQCLQQIGEKVIYDRSAKHETSGHFKTHKNSDRVRHAEIKN